MKASEIFYTAMRRLSAKTGGAWLSTYVILWLGMRGQVMCWCAENDSVRTWDFQIELPVDVDRFLRSVHDAKHWSRTHDGASIYRITIVKEQAA